MPVARRVEGEDSRMASHWEKVFMWLCIPAALD
jgi:hypothetical protein